MMSSIPRGLSCKTTSEKSHRLTSSTVETTSLSNSLSWNNQKLFPGHSRPARPLHRRIDQEIHRSACASANKEVRIKLPSRACQKPLVITKCTCSASKAKRPTCAQSKETDQFWKKYEQGEK